MAFRGRGRGRGYGGGGSFGFAKQEPFELFPELQSLPDVKGVTEERSLVILNSKLLNYWKASPFYLEENISKQSQITDIERFSDRSRPKTTLKRDSLGQILHLTRNNFPQELIEGSKGTHRSKKRVRWNPESELQKLDLLEKLEQRHQGQGEKDEKEKKGEEEEEEEEEEGKDSEEEFSDDDYYQNEYFDDDEDDYNMEDDGEDEPTY